MSLKPTVTSKQSPLYILGGGSVGLLYASLMRMGKKANNKSRSDLTFSSYYPCLLLKSHHKPKIFSSAYYDYIFKDCTSSIRNDNELLFPIHGPITLQGDSPVLQNLSRLLSVKSKSGEDSNMNSDCCSEGEVGVGVNTELEGNLVMDGDKKVDCYEYIISAFKDIHGNMTLLDIPAKIMNGSEIGSDLVKQSKPEDGYIQNILLCTKAPDAVHAVESILPLLHPTERVKIIVMTNGSMAVVSDLKSMIEAYSTREYGTNTSNNNDDENNIRKRLDIIFASTTHGAHRGHVTDEDFEQINAMTNHQTFNVHHAGLGHTYLENRNDDKEPCTIQTLSDIWNQVGLQSNLISSHDMNIFNWKKLATNCAINPLTALRQCKNGDLLLHNDDKKHGAEIRSMSKYNFSLHDLKKDQNTNTTSTNSNTDSTSHVWSYNDPRMFYQLIQEVSDVAIAEATNYDQVGYDKEINESLTYDSLVQFVEDVVRNTASNNSSMYQDVIHERYPTEIQYLNGYIARLGQEKLGISVPANEYVCKEVEKLTKTFVKN